MATVTLTNTTGNLSGKTVAVCENDQTISGAWTFSGNQTFNGNVTVGNAVGDTLTITSTIVSNLIFTDNTYDIGASGATRPRDLFLARNAAIGGTLAVTGAATFDGAVTLGNAAADAITVTGTLASNLIFTDATYDIGASGATRPRDLFLSRNATIGGTLGVTGAVTLTDDLAVNGGDLTCSATTFNLVNATVTTLNLAGAATTLTIGSTTGTATIRNATLSLTGGQIAFPSSQAASAGVNTLDDYEEGTWTPVIGGAGGTSGQTYSIQVGTYTKVGRLVTVTGYAVLTAKGTITGNVEIQGLPVAAHTLTNTSFVLPVVWTSLATTWVSVKGMMSSAANAIPIVGAAAAAVSSDTALTTADIGNATQIRVSGSYYSAT